MMKGMACTWVTCPKCGSRVCKCESANARLRCNECGHKFYVCIKNGVIVEASADNGKEELFLQACHALAD